MRIGCFSSSSDGVALPELSSSFRVTHGPGGLFENEETEFTWIDRIFRIKPFILDILIMPVSF